MTIEQRVEFLMQSIESHDRQIGGNTQHIAENAQHIAGQRTSIELLLQVSNREAESIRALARIAVAHNRRIEN